MANTIRKKVCRYSCLYLHMLVLLGFWGTRLEDDARVPKGAENHGLKWLKIRNNSGIKDEICTCYSTTILWCATLCRKQLSGAPLTLLRFYSDEPGQQSGEMDTLPIHLFGNLKYL